VIFTPTTGKFYRSEGENPSSLGDTSPSEY
jgi:hypothetical protein